MLLLIVTAVLLATLVLATAGHLSTPVEERRAPRHWSALDLVEQVRRGSSALTSARLAHLDHLARSAR